MVLHLKILNAVLNTTVIKRYGHTISQFVKLDLQIFLWYKDKEII